MMITFLDWLIVQNTTEALLRLLENAEYFDPVAYNPVFEGELAKLLDRIHDPEVRKQIEALRGFDFGNYVARSLVRAGFRGDSVQEYFHDLVMKLLLSPGKVFRAWNPARHGPLERRFRASVWNAIRNIVEKIRNRRKVVTLTDPAVMAERNPARQAYSAVLDDFRQFVVDRLGQLAAKILDWRMEGRDTKDMVGRPELGSPSVYSIKREVGEIKKLAHRFAMESGDPAFLQKVEKALAGEAATVAKRQAARPQSRMRSQPTPPPTG
jgi:hypothetical protein